MAEANRTHASMSIGTIRDVASLGPRVLKEKQPAKLGEYGTRRTLLEALERQNHGPTES